MAHSLLERVAERLDQVYIYPRDCSQLFQLILYLSLKFKSAPVLMTLARKLAKLIIEHPVGRRACMYGCYDLTQ